MPEYKYPITGEVLTERPRVPLSFEGTTTRTKQSFKEECDVNQIMKRWRATGDVSHLNLTKPTYEDYSSVDSYLESVTVVQDAQRSFDALPARVRESMQNDPAKLLEFMGNPDNLDEAVKLGLVVDPNPNKNEVKPPQDPPGPQPPAAPEPPEIPAS